MPSTAHGWLVVWLARRLSRDGFMLVGADAGAAKKFLPDNPSMSPTLRAFRPDLIAIHRRSRVIALGEAKTANDLNKAHTCGQLASMLAARDRRGRMLRVYLAVPRTCMKLAA